MIVFAAPLLTPAEQRQQPEGARPLPYNGTDPPLPTSAARKHRFEVQKAEVCEGAGEGAEGILAVFINDLECFC